MGHTAYQKLRQIAHSIARTLPVPAFYEDYRPEVSRAEKTLQTHELINKCRSHLDASQLECAHGICHCEAVARDAGAIILVEAKKRGIEGGAVTGLFEAAIIAGLLHDIKRREKDHAVLGSIEAGKILKALGMDERSRAYITYAIRNHEAFKATCDLDDEEGCLVSDALYDADKFRWGPENFTTTLWLIVESNNTPPDALHRIFQEKMKGIEKIKETFRTGTGARYGPEIIDQGIGIGNAIYEEMERLIAARGL